MVLLLLNIDEIDLGKPNIGSYFVYYHDTDRGDITSCRSQKLLLYGLVMSFLEKNGFG